jgi:hypothetical protein
VRSVGRTADDEKSTPASGTRHRIPAGADPGQERYGQADVRHAEVTAVHRLRRRRVSPLWVAAWPLPKRKRAARAAAASQHPPPGGPRWHATLDERAPERVGRIVFPAPGNPVARKLTSRALTALASFEWCCGSLLK